MNKIQKSLFRFGLLRWEVLSVLCIIALIILIRFALIPAFSFQWKRCVSISKKITFLKTADLLPSKSSAISKKADMVDSLIQLTEKQQRFSEPIVLEKLYALSDFTKCAVSKVQIGEPISISSGIEIPVLLHGTGKYSAIGKFIDGIENGEYASRIRQLTMKKSGKDHGSIFLDFVIMESSIR